ncbi:MAG: hypothetical protein QOJ89_2796 [bacterium]
MTARCVIATVAAATAITGCGIPNPNAATTPVPTVAKPATAPPAPASDPGTRRDPLVRIAVDFTLTQATWSADSYLVQKARLAQRSTGRARAQLTLPDGQSPATVAAQLKAADASSTAKLLGTDGPTRQHEVVVAYKTRATGIGRDADRVDYQVAHVTLTRHHGHWLVADFSIQP